MTHREFLARWGLSELNLNPHFAEAEFSPGAPDRAAAWELYVELLTRITTQRLAPDEGDEKAALDSVYSLFPLTRELLRKHGAGAAEFAKPPPAISAELQAFGEIFDQTFRIVRAAN